MIKDFTKHIVEGLLGEDSKKSVATFAGSFRPPTRSDYNLLLKAIEKNPGVDEIHVFVGDSESEGLDQVDSVEIFKMFGEHFPRDFHVHKSEQSPVSDVYAYASKFPTYDIDWLFGVREGNSDDFKQVADRTKSVNKYENLSISPVVYDDKATEREVGAAANMGKDELAKYMPKVLTYKELDDVYNILKPKELEDPEELEEVEEKDIEENHDPQGEMEHYKDLMDYMSSNGLNIKPYPAINFVDDDEDNAENLFGVTAYYDPNDKTVTLYTYGRHPKDILRSFAHELVHVHQDNEGRIGNIQTTNTNQDDDLVELEKEAYLTGNMMFRQWTDSIDEGKKKEYGVDAYAAELSRLRENKENLSEEQQTIKKVYSDVNDVLAGTDVPDVEWTEDGRKLWEFLFTIPVPVSLLSSTTNQERKQQWVDDTFKIKPEIIFRRSFDKHEFSEPGAVLIDNKPETIESWEEKGGIGILHKNTDDTIKQLKDLGLYGYE